MSKYSSFRHWLKEKWYEHLDEIVDLTGQRPRYDEREYFNKYKWWLRREYRYQQQKQANVD